MLIPNKFNGFNLGSRQLLIDIGSKGGGGGSQPAPTSQRVEQTSIPDYARPYVEEMLGKTSALTDINQNPYQSYGGQRIAGFTPMQAQGFGRVANQQVAGQIGEASNLASQVGQTALGAFGQGQQLGQNALGYGSAGAESGMYGQRLGVQGGQQYGQMGAGFGQQAADIGQMGLRAEQIGSGITQQSQDLARQQALTGQRFESQATDPNAIQRYMNPYTQNVTDVQTAAAQRNFDIAQTERQARAAKAGAFGGSRQAIENAEAQRNLDTQLGAIQATGQQAAYDKALQNMQFGTSAGLQGLSGAQSGLGTALQGGQLGLSGIGTALQGLQGGMQGAGIGLQGVNAQLAGTAQGMQGAQTGLQGVQGAVGAGQYGLQGLGQATQAGQLLGQLGASQFAQERDITNDMMRAGAVQQGQQQQGLDVDYQEFLKSQNYPYQQLAFSSDMLRGLPLSQAAQTQYTAAPSTASQIGGLGTTALGIYGMSGGFRANGGMVGKGYAEGGLMAAQNYRNGGDISSLDVKQLTKMLENPRLDPMERAEIEQRILLLTRMESNPEAAGIMAPRQQTAGIDAIPTGDMVPEQMAGGGIVAFAPGGGVDAIKNASQGRQSYRDRLERESADYMERASKEDPFKESRAAEEAIRAQIAESKGVSPYEALAMAGLATMEGTSQNPLVNIGAGGREGLRAFSRSKQGQAELQKQLLQQGVEREKSKFARETQLQQSRDTALGRMYAKDASLAATAAAAGDPELKALQKAQALINNNDDIPALIKQRDTFPPGSASYNAFNAEINAIRNAIFAEAGVKRKPISTPGVQLPPEPEKKGFFSGLFGGSKPEAPAQNKVVPFNQLPTKG